MAGVTVNIGEERVMNISTFDFSKLDPGALIVLIAKRRSGKSYLCKDFIRHYSNLPCGLIIAKTDKLSNFYGKFFPSTYIHYEFDPEIIAKLIDRQNKLIEKTKYYYLKKKKCDPRVLYIMDDCLSEKKSWINDKGIGELFYNGRHYQITFILTLQYCMGIGPDYRTNIDYIFLLYEDKISNQKRIYEYYAGMFPTFQIFREIFEQLTENYGCMVIVNKGVERDILKKIYYFRATGENVAHFGSEKFNRYHHQHYDSKWRTRLRTVDLDKITRKSKRVGITVKV